MYCSTLIVPLEKIGGCNDDPSKDLTFPELASLVCGAMGLLGEAASPHVNTQEPERLSHQGVSVRHAQLTLRSFRVPQFLTVSHVVKEHSQNSQAKVAGR